MNFFKTDHFATKSKQNLANVRSYIPHPKKRLGSIRILIVKKENVMAKTSFNKVHKEVVHNFFFLFHQDSSRAQVTHHLTQLMLCMMKQPLGS